MSAHQLNDVDELKQYGLDHDTDSFNLPDAYVNNQVYFMMGSVFIDERNDKIVNLYKEIQSVRKMIHQNALKRCNHKNKSEDEIIKCLSANEFFVWRI